MWKATLKDLFGGTQLCRKVSFVISRNAEDQLRIDVCTNTHAAEAASCRTVSNILAISTLKLIKVELIYRFAVTVSPGYEPRETNAIYTLS